MGNNSNDSGLGLAAYLQYLKSNQPTTIAGSLMGNQLNGYTGLAGQFANAMGGIGSVLAGNQAASLANKQLALQEKLGMAGIGAQSQSDAQKYATMESILGGQAGAGLGGAAAWNITDNPQLLEQQMGSEAYNAMKAAQTRYFESLYQPGSGNSGGSGSGFGNSGGYGTSLTGTGTNGVPFAFGSIDTGIGTSPGSIWNSGDAADTTNRAKALLGTGSTNPTDNMSDLSAGGASRVGQATNRAGLLAESNHMNTAQDANQNAQNQLRQQLVNQQAAQLNSQLNNSKNRTNIAALFA